MKATNGDTLLGGEDFDTVLVKHICKVCGPRTACLCACTIAGAAQEFKMANGIDVSNDPVAMQRIREVCVWRGWEGARLRTLPRGLGSTSSIVCGAGGGKGEARAGWARGD